MVFIIRTLVVPYGFTLVSLSGDVFSELKIGLVSNEQTHNLETYWKHTCLLFDDFRAPFWGSEKGSKPAQKAPKSAKTSSKSLFHGSSSAPLKQAHRNLRWFWCSEVSKSDSRTGQEASCSHFVPPKKRPRGRHEVAQAVSSEQGPKKSPK